MKVINRLTGNNSIESSIAIILLLIAISGMIFNLGFIATAYKQEELIRAIDLNNELLLYTGYLGLYLSTLIDSKLNRNKLLTMVLGITSLTISFVATSILHCFTLKNIYLLVFLLLVICIAVSKNSFAPENITKPVLYSLYLISFILIAIDIFSPHKIIMGWLFRDF